MKEQTQHYQQLKKQKIIESLNHTAIPRIEKHFELCRKSQQTMTESKHYQIQNKNDTKVEKTTQTHTQLDSRFLNTRGAKSNQEEEKKLSMRNEFLFTCNPTNVRI